MNYSRRRRRRARRRRRRRRRKVKTFPFCSREKSLDLPAPLCALRAEERSKGSVSECWMDN